MELRGKVKNRTITDTEKLEMWALDGADQKGDFLAGKYYKDPTSLSELELTTLQHYKITYLAIMNK